MALANDLRKGMAIRYNGNPAIVLEVQHRTPGNLRAFVQAIIRYITTGKSADVRFSSTEKVDLVERLGGEVVGALFVIELTFLDGRERLGDTDVHALIAY